MPLSDAWIDAAAGWCSGAAAVLAVQPVDTILTRRQAGLKLVTISGSSGSMAASLGPTPTFAITNLWRGAWPMIAAVPFQNALLMGGYGLGLAYTTTGIGNGESHGLDPSHKDQPVEPSYAAIFVGGTTGGILQSFLMSPVELVKVNIV
jgi:solute carrier family 25 carnitine/acylcarnitine transporter 20/29